MNFIKKSQKTNINDKRITVFSIKRCTFAPGLTIMKTTDMKKYVYLIIAFFSLLPVNMFAGNENKLSAKEAKALFNKVYNNTFGSQGSSLSYSVNIIGLYKTAGDIVYKGKKVYYKESRYMAYEDGVTAYMVDKKKQTVGIYDIDDDNKDEYLSKFKYNVDDFDISAKTEGDYYVITAKIRNASFWGVHEAVAKVLKTNLHPVSLTIKLAMLRTTVKITNYKSGDIDDKVFTFPKKLYANYKFTDNRKNK